MNIRHITRSELDAFVEFTAQVSAGVSESKGLLEALWQKRISKPEWCFVIESSGQIMGAVGYLPHGDIKSHINMMGPYLQWENDPVNTGTELMRQSLRIMHGHGKTRLHRRLFSKWDHADVQKAIFEVVNIPIVHHRIYVVWNDAVSIIKPERHNFVYRSLVDIGANAYVDALLRVVEGKLDDKTEREIRKYGFDAIADKSFAYSNGDDFIPHPEWIQVAYKQDGTLIGVIEPLQSDFDYTGYINSIGVVPEQRGNSYEDDLLSHGMQILHDVDCQSIDADVDVENTLMRKVFERAKFVENGEWWDFCVELTQFR